VRHCPGLLRFEPSGALGPHRVNAARVRERGSAGKGYVTSNLSGGRQRPARPSRSADEVPGVIPETQRRAVRLLKLVRFQGMRKMLQTLRQ